MKPKLLLKLILITLLVVCLHPESKAQSFNNPAYGIWYQNPEPSDIPLPRAIEKARGYLQAFGLPAPTSEPRVRFSVGRSLGRRLWEIEYAPGYSLEISSPDGALTFFKNYERSGNQSKGINRHGVYAIQTEEQAKAALLRYARAGGVPEDRLIMSSFRMYKDNTPGKGDQNKAGQVGCAFRRKNPGGYLLYNYGDSATIILDPLDGALVSFRQNWTVAFVPSVVRVTKEEALRIAQSSFSFRSVREHGDRNIAKIRGQGNPRTLIRLTEKLEASLKYAILDKRNKAKDKKCKVPVPANLVWVVEYGGCAILIDPVSGKELEVNINTLP